MRTSGECDKQVITTEDTEEKREQNKNNGELNPRSEDTSASRLLSICKYFSSFLVFLRGERLFFDARCTPSIGEIDEDGLMV